MMSRTRCPVQAIGRWAVSGSDRTRTVSCALAMKGHRRAAAAKPQRRVRYETRTWARRLLAHAPLQLVELSRRISFVIGPSPCPRQAVDLRTQRLSLAALAELRFD